MGSGTAASETIFFIAAIVLSTVLVGALTVVVQGISSGLNAHGETISDEFASDVKIINDPKKMGAAAATLIVYVKNTGRTTLLVTPFTFLRDGVVGVSVTFDVLNSADDSVVQVGQVLKATVNDFTVGTGDHRLRVIAGTGVSDDFDYNN